MTNVIGCIDGTDVSMAVCDYSAWASLRLDAPLKFLHVLDKSEYPVNQNFSGSLGLGEQKVLLEALAGLDEQRGKLAMRQGKHMLEVAEKRAIADGIGCPSSLQRHGGLMETLNEMEDSVRLVVLGKHDERLREHVGSDLENVVRTMHRPILITTAEFKVPERIMLAFDGSRTNHKVVDMVAGSPLFRGLPCHVVMIGASNKANEGQLEWARHTLEAADFTVTTELLSGEVEDHLCRYRKKHSIDMLIMGAYGHSVIRRFLVGSTTTSIVRKASVPVLLLR